LWIEAKESPLVFCTQVHLCSGKADQSDSATVTIQKRAKLVEQQSIKCQVCQVIVTYVEQLVAANNTVQFIVEKVEGLCNIMPAPGNAFCDQLAQQYVPALVKWILNKENPQTFCTSINFCS